MSTAGSVRSADAVSAYAPPDRTGGPPPRPRIAIVRWRGVFALLFGLAIGGAWWLVFGERVVKRTLEEGASESLGTEVDIARLRIDVAGAAIELHGLAIANPFQPDRNLLDARVARVALEPEPLLEKKIVVRRLVIEDARVGARRATRARVTANGFAPRAMREVERWAKQFQVPLLSLTPIDTIKSLVLDPTQLRTIREAIALEARADTLRRTLGASLERLPVRETIDSAQALVTRLRGANPRTLGIIGVRNAISDGRRLTTRVDSLRGAMTSFGRAARSAADSLLAATRALDEARRADYAFARGLLQLPTFDAPNIGSALFGAVSIDAFQQAMHWTALAREYAPPGLVPRESPGPRRLRRAGSTVHFVAPASYPRFWLQRGDLSLTVDDAVGGARGQYAFAVADVTTEPALVGRPTRFVLKRAASGSGIETLAISGAIDHTRSPMHEVIDVHAAGVRLPSFALPVTPLRLDLARGQSALHLDVRGDDVRGHWTVSAPKVRWQADSSHSRVSNTLEALVTRVLTGIRQIDMTADVAGTFRSPTLHVSSNLDRAVADGIKRVAGEEITRAEQRVRSQVDALAEAKLAPLRARVDTMRADVERRVADATRRLEDVKQQLAVQLKGIGIP